jgi:hypothetical protein
VWQGKNEKGKGGERVEIKVMEIKGAWQRERLLK